MTGLSLTLEDPVTVRYGKGIWHDSVMLLKLGLGRRLFARY
jgi:hypothetical protein